MNVLITGSAGFIGEILTSQCRNAGCTVLGMDIVGPASARPDSAFEICDIRNTPRVCELLATFRPDRIFDLAAQSYPTVSLIQPKETIDINVTGTVNLFECIRSARIMPTVVVACSSAEYGPVASEDLPVRETHPLRPLHPYGVSKVGQDLLAAQYFANYAIPAIRIRIFNTTGPGKLGDVCSDLTKRAVEIEMGMRAPFLRVGNLTTRRALVDAQDLVRGLWLSADCCEPGEVYNLGGDQIYAVQEIIEAIRPHLEKQFSIQQDPDLMRACDEPVIAGDITKFCSCTGWRPQIKLATTIREMLAWWRVRLAVTTSVETSA